MDDRAKRRAPKREPHSKAAPASRRLTRRELFAGGIRLTALAGLAPAALSGLLAGCGRDDLRPGHLSPDLVKGSLRVALDGDVETLDPAMYRSRTIESVIRNICDGLVGRDADMRYVPQLAVSWNVEDETRWVFRLREGVQFHSGKPFTAHDVKFTVDRVIGQIPGLPKSPRESLIGPVAGAEVIDDHTVAIITEVPYPVLDKMLVFHEVCSKADFEELGPEEFAKRPVGAGPFRVVEWQAGERIVLERFDGYYGGSPAVPPVGKAQLAGVIFRPLEEVTTRLVSLEAREVEVAVNLPPDQAARVELLDGVSVSVAQGTKTHFVGLNCSRRPFSDRRLREAMRYVVDPRPIVENFLLGRARALPGMLVPMALGYDHSLPEPRQDMAKVKRLLGEAGYPDGLDVVLDCEASDKRIAEALAGQMRAAGVRAEVRVWKRGNLLQQLRSRSRDLFLTSWGNSSLEPLGILPVLFRSDGYGNYFGFEDEQADRLLTEAERTMDADDRAAKYREVQQILHREAPTCFHFALEELCGVADRVAGFQARSDGMLPMHDVSLKT